VELRFFGPALFGFEGAGASGGDIFGQMKRGRFCKVLAFGLEWKSRPGIGRLGSFWSGLVGLALFQVGAQAGEIIAGFGGCA
jgi:hypothetical protein